MVLSIWTSSSCILDEIWGLVMKPFTQVPKNIVPTRICGMFNAIHPSTNSVFFELLRVRLDLVRNPLSSKTNVHKIEIGWIGPKPRELQLT